MSSDFLQKLFRTLGDPTRVRILLLLEREELSVGELMEVLGMAQSRVSRHLGILREAGLVRDRRDGTYALYKFVSPDEAAWRDAWALARSTLADDPATGLDQAKLARVLTAREGRERSFFDSVGGEWDALRKVWGDELLRARALSRLVPAGLQVADVGTGTGILALELAEIGCDVIAIDSSEAMLEAAARKLEAAGCERVALRQAEAEELPIADDAVDAAFAHMVLQYLESPERAIHEMARIVKPGGRVVLIDFADHDRAWMQAELGVRHMGFRLADVEAWLAAAGLLGVEIAIQPEATRGADLPETFVAHGVKPEVRT